jgi:hypothetical protein
VGSVVEGARVWEAAALGGGTEFPGCADRGGPSTTYLRSLARANASLRRTEVEGVSRVARLRLRWTDEMGPPHTSFAGQPRRLSLREQIEIKKQADPLSRVTGPRMNPSVDVGRPPRPFRHLRMAEHRSPDPSSSRAPVHSALVQISVTRHHQPGRSAFNVDAREIGSSWQVESRK